MGSWLDLIELDLTADGRRLGRGRRGDYFLFGGRNFYPTWDEGGGAETEWRPWEVLWTRRGVRVRRVVHEDAASLDVELPRTSDVWLTGRVANGFAGRVRIVLDGPFLVLTPEHRACVLALDLGMAPPGLRASHSAAERDAAVRRGRARTRDFIARRDADVFFAVPLGRFASRTIGVGTAAGEGGARHRARMGSRDFLPLRVAGSASWDAYMEREVPELTCDDDSVARAYAHSFFILKANRIRYGKAPLVRPHTMPSRFWYTNQWWWDSSFHMAGQRWLADKAWAHHELDNFLHHQWPNGMIPAELHVNRRYGELWFKGCRDPWASSYTINPVPAWLIHKVWQVTGDRKCLARWLPPLVRYHDWYLGCRLDRGLLFSDDTFEVQDDSPRYDALRVRGPTSHGMRRVHVIETNAFFCLQARALSRIARVLGKRALSARLAREGDEVAAEMKRRLWDPAAGLFFDRTVAPDRAIPVRVNAAFFPLLLDVLDARERAVLLRHFRNPREFGTRWPLPTVAASDRSFSPTRMWRGPTWIMVNWLVIAGLRRQGEHALAARLARRQLEMVSRDGYPRINEWYNPLTGEALGQPDYGWGVTVADLVITAGAGILPAERGIFWHPLDLGLRRMEFGPVRVRGRSVRVALWDGRYYLWVDGKRAGETRAGTGPLFVPW